MVLMISITLVSALLVAVPLVVFTKMIRRHDQRRSDGGQTQQEQAVNRVPSSEQVQQINHNHLSSCLTCKTVDEKRSHLLNIFESNHKIYTAQYNEWSQKQGKLVVNKEGSVAGHPNCVEYTGGWLEVDDLCSICLESYEVHEKICFAINHTCTHYFHLECMLTWLLDHDKCPMCSARYLEEEGGITPSPNHV